MGYKKTTNYMQEFKPTPDWLADFEQEVEQELKNAPQTASGHGSPHSLSTERSAPSPGSASENASLSELHGDLGSIHARIETIQAELKALVHLGRGMGSKEMLAGLPKIADDLQDLLHQLDSSGERLSKEAERVAEQNANLSESQTAFQSQLAELRAKVGMAQEGYETRIRALQEQIKALQDQRKIMETNAVIQAARIERLEEELQRSHAEKMAAETKNLENQGRIIELEGSRNALGSQLAALQGALDELRRHFPRNH